MTVREILAEGRRLLSSPCPSACIDNPALDASLLLCEILKARREDLILRENENLTEKTREEFYALIERRKAGECTAYILGRKEFRGLDFTVNSSVLVPRPDTETLVEAALEYINTLQKNDKSLLDLCTGSGALAISLKNEHPLLSVTASDISAEALETAALNAGRLLGGTLDGAAARRNSIRFIQSDLFDNIPDRFDIIVSNPPYVPSGELPGLAPEVRREPKLALDGGKDGLDLIRKIVSRSPSHLLQGGTLFLEAAPEQMQAIKKLLENNRFGNILIRKDLADRDRVISGELWEI